MNLSSYTWWKQKKKKRDGHEKKYFCFTISFRSSLLVSCGGSKSATLDEVKSPEMVYGMSAVVGVEESLSGMAINPMSANDVDDEHNQDLQAIEEVTDLDLLMGLMNDDLFTVEEKESDREGYAHLIAIEFNKNAYNFYYNEVLADEEVDEDEVEKEYEITGIIVVEDYLKLSEVNIEIYVNEDEGYNYKYKMIVKTENLFGNVTEYILYYDEERDIDDDEEEKEMTGILIYQNVTYQFKSEEEIEADESEIKVTIYENDYNDRLEIEKEFEDGEYQYTYKLYRNDDEYLSVELEVEESEMELIIKKKNEDDDEFLIVSQPNNTFNITYDEDFIFTLVIDIENKKYIYSFDETIITK